VLLGVSLGGGVETEDYYGQTPAATKPTDETRGVTERAKKLAPRLIWHPPTD